MKKQLLAVIRKDLLEKDISVPVGNTFYGEKEPLPYKYKGEQFYVFLNNEWQEADTIDFEFNS